MSIGISDEHVELAASLRKWGATLGATAAVRAAEADPAALGDWGATAAGMGLTSVALPERFGGGGGTVLDQAVALEAAAYALVPGPILSTAVAGLLVAGESVCSGIVAGTVTVGIGVRGRLSLADGVLSGEVPLVLDAPSVSHLLLEAFDGESHWVVVPAGLVTITPGVSPDLSRTVGSIRVDGLRLDEVDGVEEVILGDGTDGAAVTATLLAMVAAELSGVARWCLDTAVDHAGVREQFGQKIGAFQAVKHLCAEMLENSESVTAAAWDAAASFSDDERQREFATLVAGTLCPDGAVSVAKACIQVLGGIGFTFEHDAHLYLRRALMLRSLLGSLLSGLSDGPSGGTDAWAERLASLAADGVRRAGGIDLQGRDEAYRDSARKDAARIAAAPEPERRALLARDGYLAPHWPAPYGLGADPVQQLVIEEELAAAGVERPDLQIGAWAAPTILAHGTEGQRERFVGPTLAGDLVWCQLFSEPGAGSDLASLRTRAERVEGGWSLTGQKVWTSLARDANWAICLARTDPAAKPHAGISYFLLDMGAEGIDIRPLREITGEEMFNEVFLDDVFVPDDCVVGEVNGGWRLARTTLANERVAMAGTRLGESVEQALAVAEGPVARTAVGKAVAWSSTVKLLGMRAALRSIAGQGPGAESSVAKLVGVRSRQDSAELLVELLGAEIFTDSPRAQEAMHQLLLTRCLSIAGGTTQILRNVAAERILGLPRG